MERKQVTDPAPAVPPAWEETVARMRGRGLSGRADEIVLVRYDQAGDRRVVFMKSRRGYYRYEVETLCLFDEDDLIYVGSEPGMLPAYWRTDFGGAVSLFGTLGEAERDFDTSLDRFG